MYNGKYETVIDLRIESEYHAECLEITKLAKKLCDSWACAGVRYSEHKSARKGDVLRRDLLIYQTAYAHETIIFRESLQCALLNFIFSGNVKFRVRLTTPIDNQIK